MLFRATFTDLFENGTHNPRVQQLGASGIHKRYIPYLHVALYIPNMESSSLSEYTFSSYKKKLNERKKKEKQKDNALRCESVR